MPVPDTCTQEDDPIVVSNSKGSYWSTADMRDPSTGAITRSHADLIQLAIEDLSNGRYPDLSDIEIVYPGCPPESPELDNNGCRKLASDCEVNYYQMAIIPYHADKSTDFWNQSWQGTVWVHMSVEIDKAIRLRRELTLDFLNHLAKLVKDVSFVTVGQGADGCWRARLCNARVSASPGQTSPILQVTTGAGCVQLVPGTPLPKLTEQGGVVEHNCFENIVIESDKNDLTSRPCFDGVHLYNSGGYYEYKDPVTGKDELVVVGGQYSQYNLFKNIHMRHVRHAVLFEQATWNAGYNNGNLFQGIHADDFVYLVRFKTAYYTTSDPSTDEDDTPTERAIVAWRQASGHDYSGIAQCHNNTFIHCRGYTSSWTLGGIVDIYGNRTRLDHVAVVNFPTTAIEYSARSRVEIVARGLTGNYACLQSLTRPQDLIDTPTGLWTVDAPLSGGAPTDRPYTPCLLDLLPYS